MDAQGDPQFTIEEIKLHGGGQTISVDVSKVLGFTLSPYPVVIVDEGNGLRRRYAHFAVEIVERKNVVVVPGKLA
jgi:hypothetical protein